MVNCFLNGVWLYLEGYMPAIIEIVYTVKVNDV